MHNAPNERCGTAPLFHMPSYIYNNSHDHWNLWSGATSCPSSRVIQVPSSQPLTTSEGQKWFTYAQHVQTGSHLEEVGPKMTAPCFRVTLKGAESFTLRRFQREAFKCL